MKTWNSVAEVKESGVLVYSIFQVGVSTCRTRTNWKCIHRRQEPEEGLPVGDGAGEKTAPWGETTFLGPHPALPGSHHLPTWGLHPELRGGGWAKCVLRSRQAQIFPTDRGHPCLQPRIG